MEEIDVPQKINDYLDSSLTALQRAEILLGQMSIEEKMAQTVGYFPRGIDQYDDLAAEYPHGAGQVSCLEMRSLTRLEDAVKFQRDLQTKIMALSEHRIPAIFHMEGLCGAYLPGAVSFPSGICRGSSWRPELEEKIGEIVGRQERTIGITHTFAPVLDISRDSRMGRQGESYGEDPTLAAAMGSKFVSGLQSYSNNGLKTHSVAKHFLGFHASYGGIHGTDCEVSDSLLREVYAKPFQAAISESNIQGVMPCYNSVNGEPIHGSQELLQGLLRDEMGFTGTLVSDYCAIMNMHSVQKTCNSFAEAGLKAMAAGMDYEVHFKKCYNEELAEMFRTGQADISVLDRIVKRILTQKFEMGLFENPYAVPEEELPVSLSSDEDRAISLESARAGMVLLKNDGLLPLKNDIKKIAVIGCHAASARFLFGGYTHYSMVEGLQAFIHTMAGIKEDKAVEKIDYDKIPGTQVQTSEEPIYKEILDQQNPEVKSLLEQLRINLPACEIKYAYGYPAAGNDDSHHEEALATAAEADVVIITVGGKNGTGLIATMGEGIDSTDINLPRCQEEFIEKLGRVGKPFAAVHFNGRPISSDAADKYANAILEAWNPSEMGAQAITEILTGAYNPGGKLPASIAHNAGQIPVYYNHPNGSNYHQGESIGFVEYIDVPHTPRYFFGHGLSYTDFTYGQLEIDQKNISADGSCKIACTVTNSGNCGGDEVVQLYVSDRFASRTRPVMELAGFARVSLNAGESKRVVFDLAASQLAYVDRENQWFVEAGEIDIMIGSSSNDIRLRDEIVIADSKLIDGRERAFYAAVDLE
jgi:beta-glucosidase